MKKENNDNNHDEGQPPLQDSFDLEFQLPPPEKSSLQNRPKCMIKSTRYCIEEYLYFKN